MDAPVMPMPAPLQALLRQRKVKKDYAADGEVETLLRIAGERLQDAGNPQLHIGCRYDLTYLAALSSALAILRWHNCHTDSVFLIFQSLQFTIDLSKPSWRVLNQGRQHYDFLENHWRDMPNAGMLAELQQVATDMFHKARALTAL